MPARDVDQILSGGHDTARDTLGGGGGADSYILHHAIWDHADIIQGSGEVNDFVPADGDKLILPEDVDEIWVAIRDDGDTRDDGLTVIMTGLEDEEDNGYSYLALIRDFDSDDLKVWDGTTGNVVFTNEMAPVRFIISPIITRLRRMTPTPTASSSATILVLAVPAGMMSFVAMPMIMEYPAAQAMTPSMAGRVLTRWKAGMAKTGCMAALVMISFMAMAMMTRSMAALVMMNSMARPAMMNSMAGMVMTRSMAAAAQIRSMAGKVMMI